MKAWVLVMALVAGVAEAQVTVTAKPQTYYLTKFISHQTQDPGVAVSQLGVAGFRQLSFTLRMNRRRTAGTYVDSVGNRFTDCANFPRYTECRAETNIKAGNDLCVLTAKYHFVKQGRTRAYVEMNEYFMCQGGYAEQRLYAGTATTRIRDRRKK